MIEDSYAAIIARLNEVDTAINALGAAVEETKKGKSMLGQLLARNYVRVHARLAVALEAAWRDVQQLNPEETQGQLR